MSLILDLIFPKSCCSCGQMGSYICPKCLAKTKILPVSNLKSGKAEACLSLFKYNAIIKKVIYELKYNFVSDLADDLVFVCVETIKKHFPHLLEYWQQNQFVLVPIPLYPSRQNWRGFNQSEILGNKLAANLNLGFNSQLLLRSTETKTQALLSKSNRHKNTQNAFEMAKVNGQKLPKNIILFDDVATTRSTLSSALNAFKIDGLNHCWYLTVAG
jgi:ComF family protein